MDYLEDTFLDIKNKYPAAYGSLREYLDDNNLNFDYYFVDQYLDSIHIYIDISPEVIKIGGCQECYKVDGFTWNIYMNDIDVEYLLNDYDGSFDEENYLEDAKEWTGRKLKYATRSQALSAAYINAFGYLEAIMTT